MSTDRLLFFCLTRHQRNCMLTSMNEIKAWIKANSYRKLAEPLGIYPNAVVEWVQRGRIPAERVHAVSRITKIPPSRLRPDLFGPEARKVNKVKLPPTPPGR